eukprot:gene5498-11071_t
MGIESKSTTASQPVRLYCKGTILGYKRGRRNTYTHTTLIKIDGCNDKSGSDFYLGKKIAYIYKAKTEKAGSKFRVVWGKVLRGHGANGIVKAKFATNISSSAMGSGVRIMLYPSRSSCAKNLSSLILSPKTAD